MQRTQPSLRRGGGRHAAPQPWRCLSSPRPAWWRASGESRPLVLRRHVGAITRHSPRRRHARQGAAGVLARQGVWWPSAAAVSPGYPPDASACLLPVTGQRPGRSVLAGLQPRHRASGHRRQRRGSEGASLGLKRRSQAARPVQLLFSTSRALCTRPDTAIATQLWEIVCDGDGAPGVKHLDTLVGHTRTVNAVRFAPGGDVLATAVRAPPLLGP